MQSKSSLALRVLAAGVAALSAAATYGQTNTGALYLNPDLPAERRAADLVLRMTLEEKVLQMQNGAPAIARLGIPAYDWWNEALHGVARAGLATVFPQAIGMAATWDPALMHRIADVISTEARAKYNEAIRKDNHSRYRGLTFWSPNINIFRDPRWGRGRETYGEDPYLPPSRRGQNERAVFRAAGEIRAGLHQELVAEAPAAALVPAGAPQGGFGAGRGRPAPLHAQLEAGRAYRLRVEYAAPAAGGSAQLMWIPRLKPCWPKRWMP